MKEISNRTIVALLAVALVVTIVGTGVSISRLGGFSSGNSYLTGANIQNNGTTTVVVVSTASVALGNASLDFGTGYFNTGNDSGPYNTSHPTCRLQNYSKINSNGNSHECWLNVSGGLTLPLVAYHQIENNGTTVINLSVDTNVSNAETFLCAGASCASTVANVSFYGADNETGSCNTAEGTFTTTGYNLLSSGATDEFPKDLCTKFEFDTNSNSLKVYWALTIPRDAGGGTKQMTISYTGVAN